MRILRITAMQRIPNIHFKHAFDAVLSHCWFACRALNSRFSATRARPFDILYNLSLHAELLYSPSRDSTQVMHLLSHGTMLDCNHSILAACLKVERCQQAMSEVVVIRIVCVPCMWHYRTWSTRFQCWLACWYASLDTEDGCKHISCYGCEQDNTIYRSNIWTA